MSDEAVVEPDAAVEAVPGRRPGGLPRAALCRAYRPSARAARPLKCSARNLRQAGPLPVPWSFGSESTTPEGRTADIGQVTVNVRECPILKRELEATGNYRKGKADIWEMIDGVQRCTMILGCAMGRIPVVGGDDPPDEDGGEDGAAYDPQLMVYMIEDGQGKGWKRLMAAAYQYCKKNYGRAPEQLPRFLSMIEQWQIETIGHIENQWSPEDDSDSEADADEPK